MPDHGQCWLQEFEQFLLDCGIHLLDLTPCADGRLAHTVAYALRIPFSAVRRRSHAGAMFDVENTVNRWVKTEHRRYREGVTQSLHGTDPLSEGGDLPLQFPRSLPPGLRCPWQQ